VATAGQSKRVKMPFVSERKQHNDDRLQGARDLKKRNQLLLMPEPNSAMGIAESKWRT
jgi:hypothetical protein